MSTVVGWQATEFDGILSVSLWGVCVGCKGKGSYPFWQSWEIDEVVGWCVEVRSLGAVRLSVLGRLIGPVGIWMTPSRCT